MSYRYAQETTVPVATSKASVERLLKGAGATHFFIGETDSTDVVGCKIAGRFVRFQVVRPTEKWAQKEATTKRNPTAYNRKNGIEQEHRRRWRCMELLIKAKLAAVDGKIRTFEQEFLADTLMPDQRTVYEHVSASLADAYEHGKVGATLQLGPASAQAE
jgi:hypothetical protein